jgi:cold shock CspA family protein
MTGGYRLRGIVRRILRAESYAFILATDGKQYFAHHTACSDRTAFEGLREGDTVTFAPETGPKGPRAERVRIIEVAKRQEPSV